MSEPKPGDVILYPADGMSSLASRLVAAGELLAGLGKGLVQYSHAAILDVEGYQFEAYFPKTRYSKIDQKRLYEIWRLGEITPAERQRILGWCKAHVGRWYNLIGVLTADHIRIPDTYYCSQFAGLAYAAIGKKVGDRIMSPDSIPDFPGAKKIFTNEPIIDRHREQKK